MISRAILAVLLCSASTAFADGDCPTRPATQAERSAWGQVAAAVRSAAPPAPKDWVRRDPADPGGGTEMPACPGGDRGAPLRYQFRFQYELDRNVRAQAEAKVMQQAMQGTPEQQARIAALDAKLEGLQSERKDARKRGDRDAVERIKGEMRTAESERDRLNDEVLQAYAARAQSGALARNLAGASPARTSAEVAVFVNADRAWMPQDAEAVNVPGAGRAYWRSNDQGSLVVLVGGWDQQRPTVTAPLRTGAVIPRPQTFLVEIRAERQLAERMAREMRIGVLDGQLRQ